MTKCAECGYLSLRDLTDRTLVEAERDYRENLRTPSRGPNTGYEGVPLCFMQAFDFRTVTKDRETKEREAALRAAVTEEHKTTCPEFCEWQQGFTPKEHAEMIQQKALLEWQRDEARIRREWQAKQEELAAQRHADQLEATAKHNRANLAVVADATRWNLRGALYNAAILSVATVVSAFLASVLTVWFSELTRRQ